MTKLKCVLIILLGGCFFSGCTNEHVSVDIDKTALSYFQESYDDCRDNFISASKEIKSRYKNVEEFSLSIPSQIDDDLTINGCYIPAQSEKKKLLIISSGIHGVEGFAGSAIQQMFMHEMLKEMDLANVGVLLIHGMNPYGFKYVRRVTENNVDLNRNSDVDRALFKIENTGYAKLNEMLNPQKKVDLGSFKNRFFIVQAVIKIVRHSMSTLRQAILQGQYSFENGLYYGGQDFEPQINTIKPVLLEIGRDYMTILTIDLHTGYGQRNRLHLFPNPVENKVAREKLEHIFKGYSIDWGDTEDFYTVTGAFADFIGKVLADKFYMPMAFEYGTLDSQTTTGSVKSIHNMIIENQGYHHGYETKADEQEVKRRFREMYFPSSNEWRSEIIRQSREVLKVALERYAAL